MPRPATSGSTRRPEPPWATRAEPAAFAQRERALAVLTDPALAHVVDLVAHPDGDGVVVANAAGSSRWDGQEWETLDGRSPVADQDPLHGTPLARALDDPSPPNARNSYPLAGPRLASLFRAADRAPDLAVVHTAAHHWPERGGHLGEHGSLDAAQSRAPLLLSGPGVEARGVLGRAARVLDVAPTLARLAGAQMPGAEGAPLPEVGGGAAFVVGLLWDGANAADLLDLAQRGELPAVARLLERGCAFAGGAVAEFPSVTLVNHASALTGVGSGRHGIVHNVYRDRTTGERVLANDSATWHLACDLLRPGVGTVFEALATADPRAGSACVNEPVDRGAGYSTFGLVRDSGDHRGAAGLDEHLPPAAEDPHAAQDWVAANPDYAWSTQVDALGLAQMCQLWEESVTPPRLTWWNTTLTDSGHHGGGPYSAQARASLRDADRRLGVFLDLLDRTGRWGQTAVLLTADHGSEGADPECTGDWDEALTDSGVAFRDEGYGFLYLGP